MNCLKVFSSCLCCDFKMCIRDSPASEENLPEIAEYMKIRMKQFLEKQSGKSGEQIAQERYERFRKM